MTGGGRQRVGVRASAWRRLALLVLALACAPGLAGGGLPGAAAAVAPGTERLGKRLEAALQVRALRRARVSALVVRASDGAVLFERAPDTPLTPASNMKILTAMAALETFGPTWRFETPLFADRLPDADGRVGTLYLQGSGDPVLNSEDWWRMAADLHRHGLRAVLQNAGIVVRLSGASTTTTAALRRTSSDPFRMGIS